MCEPQVLSSLSGYLSSFMLEGAADVFLVFGLYDKLSHTCLRMTSILALCEVRTPVYSAGAV